MAAVEAGPGRRALGERLSQDSRSKRPGEPPPPTQPVGRQLRKVDLWQWEGLWRSSAAEECRIVADGGTLSLPQVDFPR